MEVREFKLTPEAILNGRLLLDGKSSDFFERGRSICVHTSLAGETGETTTLARSKDGSLTLRRASIIRRFVDQHDLTSDDRVRFRRIAPHEYLLLPLFREMRFIDLFAGIGGMRMAFEANGGECVFSSEWDRYCGITYETNFDEQPRGDIRSIEASRVPDHEILVGGFPCQPFSIAGVSKKNSLGRQHGFHDETQGTLFFDVARIISEKRPRAFVLENVKNLRRHDSGRTFEVVRRTLEDELGYRVHTTILDGATVVPQHRERIFIVGFRDAVPFEFPDEDDLAAGFRRFESLGDLLEGSVDPKYTLSDKLWKYLQDYAEKHRRAGNGFGFGLVGPNDRARTLSARYYKDGSEILVRQRGGRNPRRLTPRECARLMGFPEWFRIPVSNTQAYKQFGNSVVVPVVQAVAERVIAALRTNPPQRKRRLRKKTAAAR